MELNEQMVEVFGALLGDGCISKYWSNSEGHWRYEVTFTGSLGDFNYYKSFIQPVFQQYFGIHGRLFTRDNNSTRYHIRSKRVFDFFVQYGVPIGKKGPNLKIPEEIVSDARLALACVRGVWNTDGSIYQRYRRAYVGHPQAYKHYLVMQLKMTAGILVNQVKHILNLNGIQTTKITKTHNFFVLRITRQEAIAEYLRLINFSNKHHLNRLDQFRVETDGLKCFTN